MPELETLVRAGAAPFKAQGGVESKQGKANVLIQVSDAVIEGCRGSWLYFRPASNPGDEPGISSNSNCCMQLWQSAQAPERLFCHHSLV